MKLVVTVGANVHKIELPEPLIDGLHGTLTLDGKPLQFIWRAAAWSLVLVDGQGVERNLSLRGARVSRFEGDTESHVEATLHMGAGHMASLRASVSPDLPGVKSSGNGSGQTARVIRSQITGKVLKVMVKAGDTVQSGDTLMLIEAMKMENRVFAPTAGKISGVSVKEGDSVATGKELLRMEAQ